MAIGEDMIGLTDEDNPYKDKPGCWERQVFFRGGQAQLKKVVEWLETKGHLERDEGSGDWYWEFDSIIKAHEWQALSEEVK